MRNGREWRRLVPSPRSENPILWILYGTIQLPVLQESFRIVSVWLRVYGFIVAYRPIHQHSQTDDHRHIRLYTHQTFSMIVAPEGMRYPLYILSSITRFGTPNGTGQAHRSNSLINAEI